MWKNLYPGHIIVIKLTEEQLVCYFFIYSCSPRKVNSYMWVRGQVQLQLLLPLQSFTHDHVSRADGCLTGGLKPGSEQRKHSTTTTVQPFDSFIVTQKSGCKLVENQYMLNEQQSFSGEIYSTENINLTYF